MDFKRGLFLISLAVAGLSLVVSFSLARQVLPALATLLPLGAMVWARKPSFSWLATCSLVGFTGLSTAGIVLGLPLIPMALASTAALVSWDLALELHSGSSLSGSSAEKLYERAHLKSLGTAVGLGVLGAGFGQWIHWQAPFVGMLALVFVALFCLDRILKNSQRQS
jgi:hypothetical protein